MKSNNPVFANSEEFNRSVAVQSDPSQWTINLDQGTSPNSLPPVRTDRMTLDSVVEKTALTIGTVVIAAAVTWFLIGDFTGASQEAVQRAWMFAIGGAVVGFVLAMVNSFKKIISPALVLAYAVAEGVFIGAFSKVVAGYVGSTSVVFQAVLATMVAFFGTLAAYKFFNIQVTPKFRKVVMISLFSFVGVMLVNLVLSLTGVVSDGGLRGFNGIGLIVSVVAVIIAVFCLIMDFDYVEQGVAAGLPERESWRAAFGLTVTLVWLYIEMLRILAILRGDS